MSGEFDLALLQEFADACSRRDFFETFVRAALADLQSASRALHDAGARGEWRDFQDQAHAIKGLAATIGAVEVARVAALAMRRLHAHLPVAWRDDARRVKEAVHKACIASDAALATLRPPGA